VPLAWGVKKINKPGIIPTKERHDLGRVVEQDGTVLDIVVCGWKGSSRRVTPNDSSSI
jgi:hypothetical protein